MSRSLRLSVRPLVVPLLLAAAAVGSLRAQAGGATRRTAGTPSQQEAEARAQAEEQRQRDLREPRVRIPLIMDPGSWRWVQGIMERLVQATDRKLEIPDATARAILAGRVAGPTPRFVTEHSRDHVLLLLYQSPQVNAFATADRQVYVTRGLLEFVRSDDELAGVLAHELGHLLGGHHKRLARKQGLLQVLGTIGGLLASGGNSGGALAGMSLGQMSGLRYNRQAEHDADRRGLAMMREAGYHPIGMLRFMERLNKEHGDDPEDSLSVFFSTHPPSQQRAAIFRREIDALGELQAPAGLTYDFSRSLYSPGLGRRSAPEGAGAEASQVTSVAAATEGTTVPAHVVRLHALLGEDFSWKPLVGPGGARGLPADAVLVRFGGWAPLPETWSREGGAVLPGGEGLLMNPGTTLRGPQLPLMAETSYLVATRLRPRGRKVRAFVGLELLDEAGKFLGAVYPAAPGLFLEEDIDRRLAGVVHPFDLLEATGGKVPRQGRLVVRAGTRAEGQLVLEELACLPVGRDEEEAGRDDTVGPDGS